MKPDSAARLREINLKHGFLPWREMTPPEKVGWVVGKTIRWATLSTGTALVLYAVATLVKWTLRVVWGV